MATTKRAQYLPNASDLFAIYAETVFEYTGSLLVREKVSYPALVAVTTYEYAEGRLVKKSSLDGKNKLLHYTVYEYDGLGKLTTKTNFIDSGRPSNFVHYTYRNGLRQLRQMFGGDPAGPSPELFSTIRYAYDAQKRLVFETTEYISPYSSSLSPSVKYEYY